MDNSTKFERMNHTSKQGCGEGVFFLNNSSMMILMGRGGGLLKFRPDTVERKKWKKKKNQKEVFVFLLHF